MPTMTTVHPPSSGRTPQGQMTVREFLAFAETRPSEERWELVEGVPVLNASPIDYHQVIVGNILYFLLARKAENRATWLPMIGIGTRVPASPNSLPQPDVFVMASQPTGSAQTDDALVIFEVLSRSNRKADRDWRRRVYASVPNCQHYVTVAMRHPEVTAYDRATAWKARPVKGFDSSLDLAALGLALPLADIYRYTSVGQGQ
jgi:Uma2 family endonuclease